jgi:hypothetical protein
VQKPFNDANPKSIAAGDWDRTIIASLYDGAPPDSPKTAGDALDSGNRPPMHQSSLVCDIALFFFGSHLGPKINQSIVARFSSVPAHFSAVVS